MTLDRHFKPIIKPLQQTVEYFGVRAIKRQSRDDDATSAFKRERKEEEEEEEEGEKASETFEHSAIPCKANWRAELFHEDVSLFEDTTIYGRLISSRCICTRTSTEAITTSPSSMC